MAEDPIRFYVVLKANRKDLKPNYFNRDSDAADRWATTYIAENVYGSAMDHPPFRTRARPTNQIYSGDRARIAENVSGLVVALDITGDRQRSRHDVVNDIVKAVEKKPEIFAGSSPDLPFAAADHWCIGDAGNSIFGDRKAAERILNIDYLRSRPHTTGKGVNVVIVDQGLDKHVLGTSYGGGWSVGNSHPGTPLPDPGTVRRPHAMMIAHNILKIAPEATLFDMPLAPTKISDIPAFLSFADAAFAMMESDISLWRKGQFPGPWILVNPWGIFDRRTEIPRGYYTEKRNNHFNQLVLKAVQHNMDVVFAAGNCGQFCPDSRCGGEDRGPARSIWGANSLDEVLTIGAVRSDDMWLGYSSQGPGQPDLDRGTVKPDVCASSHFRENADAFSINTGTSAATGMAAGIVAALRSRWNDPTTVTPHILKQVLNQTARKPPTIPWSPIQQHRFGNGVMNARAAYDTLAAQYP